MHIDLVDARTVTGRVAVALVSRLSTAGWRFLSQAELAQSLGVDQSTVSRSLADLVRLCVVERRGRGCAVVWRLPPVSQRVPPIAVGGGR